MRKPGVNGGASQPVTGTHTGPFGFVSGKRMCVCVCVCGCVCRYMSFDTASLEQTLGCDQSSSLSDFAR